MPSLQLMGILELGNGRFAQALAHFADAEAQGLQFTEYHAATQAAMRKFDEAKATLARSPAGAAKGNPAMAITRASLNAALLVDQGKLEQASTLLDEAARAETDGKVLAQAFSIMRLTLISADPPLSGDDLRSAKQQLEDVLAQRKSAQTARRQTLDAQALILAYVLARANERDLARRVLAAIPLADMPSGSSNAKLRSVVEAELDRIEGRHGAGIQRLETLLDGSELFITHVAPARCLRRCGTGRQGAAAGALVERPPWKGVCRSCAGQPADGIQCPAHDPRPAASCGIGRGAKGQGTPRAPC
jgi:hypothetical protein